MQLFSTNESAVLEYVPEYIGCRQAEVSLSFCNPKLGHSTDHCFVYINLIYAHLLSTATVNILKTVVWNKIHTNKILTVHF